MDQSSIQRTKLQLANLKIRQKHFSEAIQIYENLLTDKPELHKIIQFNLSFARQKYGGHSSKEKHEYDSKKELSSKNRKSQDIYDVINKSGLFDEIFYAAYNPDVPTKSCNDYITHYLNHGYKEGRNPSVHFDSDYYARTNPDVSECGLVHFINSGRFNGRRPYAPYTVPFTVQKIREAAEHRTNARVAIHAHLFYPDVIHEVVAVSRNMPVSYDLLITTTTEADAFYIRRIADREATAENVRIEVVSNIGRDVLPMFTALRDAWSSYDYICHLHSKKSPHTYFGNKWRYYLFDQLMGSPGIISTVLKEFDDNPTLGLLFPDNVLDIKRYVDWSGNLPAAQELFDRLGLNSEVLEGSWEFAAGSMCWMRAEAMRPLTKLKLEDFESEDGAVEGTLAHVVERCLPYVPAAQGYQYRKYIANIQDLKRYRAIPPTDFRTSPVEVGRRWASNRPDIAAQQRRPLAPLHRTFNPRSINIHWIIPDFVRGLGGHMTIFRHVYHLDQFGHRQTVWIRHAHQHVAEQQAKERIQKWFQPISNRVIVRFLPDDVSGISGDAVICTEGWTVYPAMAMPFFKERFYLIQDFEPYFHARGTNSFLLENTYRMGLKALPAGNWLHQIATERFGMWARSWSLAYDPRTYYPPETRVAPEQEKRLLRIALYARQTTPRRAVDLALLALDLLHGQGVEFEAHFFGQDSKISPAYAHKHHGILQAEELGDLYRDCDIGVVFSGTNYSLIPMEMMGCDLPVVELDGESTRAIFPEDAVEYAAPDPAAIAAAIKHLIDSPERRAELVNGGRRFISSLDWRESARRIEAALIEGLSENNTPVVAVECVRSAAPAALKASVFIPTFNAGPEFADVLEQVVTQETPWPYEVLVIDSGSSDETCDIVRRYADCGVRLHQIPNSEFQHGRTRNLGIEMTKGEFIAILTQDAKPANMRWLECLVAAFDQSDMIGGVFGRHLPYPNASPFVHRDLIGHFAHYGDLPRVVSWERGIPSQFKYGSDEWQQKLHFFSDNNACIRRSVWQNIPYPEIDWGEDQVWAWEIIKQGYEKAYAPDAVVYHSHNLTPEAQQKVAKHEGFMFKAYFNYRLVPDSKESLEHLIRQVDDRDEAYAKEHKVPKAAMETQKRLNKAMVLGRRLGIGD